MNNISDNKKYIYITAPIFYPSDKPHVGHAFSLIIADVLKRYYQLIHANVIFVTGTDEHGEKILKKSQEENKLTTQEFVDKNSDTFKHLCHKYKISFNCFGKTSSEQHTQFVQNTFSAILKNEDIFFGKWNGYYCISCEENYSEKEYKRSQKCSLNHDLKHREEETFFLKTKTFKDYLKKLYSDNKNIIVPNWYTKEIHHSFIEHLEDLSITRKQLSWGVKTKEKPDFTIYVWFDALLTYISCDEQNLWDKPNTRIIHIIGKDILRFHAIYWPIILNSLNKKNFNKLISHGWILFNQEKMSKSLGNVVDPVELLNHFQLDILRFFFINLNWELDNKFSHNDICQSNNTYLANLFGNIIFRLFGLIKKHQNHIEDAPVFEDNEHLSHLNNQVDKLSEQFKDYINSENVPQLLEDLFKLLRDTNKTIDTLKPWTFDITTNLYKTTIIVIYKVSCFAVFSLSPILVENAATITETLSFDIMNFKFEYFKDISNFKNKTTKGTNDPFFKRIELEKTQNDIKIF